MNLWSRFRALIPDPPLLVGTVTAHLADGTSRVELPSGGVIYPRGTGVESGSMAFVKDGVVIGQAPTLSVVEVEV